MKPTTRFILAFGLAGLLVRLAAAQVPNVVSYQGYLELAGEPVDDPADRLIFKIYASADGGSALWTEQHLDVPVVEGVFSVLLGSVNAVGFQGLPFGEPLWLGVNPGAGELTPRTPLVAAPYSISTRGIRIVETTPEHAPSVIAGHASNDIGPGVHAATISGGGYDVYATIGTANLVTDNYGAVGGGGGNQAGNSSGLVTDADYATVSGGRDNTASDHGATVGGGSQNTASGRHATIAGGFGHEAGPGTAATVAGGVSNTASGYHATVGGGRFNSATGIESVVAGGDRNTSSGNQSTVSGGYYNAARGDYSMAAGSNAKARHEGSFVWSDRSLQSIPDSLYTTASNQFLIRAAGGVGIGTNTPAADVHIRGDSNTGRPHMIVQETGPGDYARIQLQNSDGVILKTEGYAAAAAGWHIAAGGPGTDRLNFWTRDINVLTLWPDDNSSTSWPNLITTSAGTAKLTQGGVWTNSSSEDSKTDFAPVNARGIAERVAALRLQEWRYRVEPEHVRHIGPTAEDFYAAFGLGDSDESIGTVDTDGVALAAIQGLHELVLEQRAEIEEQAQAIADIKDEVASLRAMRAPRDKTRRCAEE